MLINCPLGKKETHACWGCIFSTPIHNDEGEVTDYFCHHKDYKETIKVKPRKIKPEVFCIECNKKVKFRVEKEGVASPTPKGVIIYKELYAYCPHCYREVYVPAANDINVRSRQKAFEEKIKNEG